MATAIFPTSTRRKTNTTTQPPSTGSHPLNSSFHPGLWIVPCLWKSHDPGFPTDPWKTLRVSHTTHSPYDNIGDISNELRMGTFLTSVDTPEKNEWRAAVDSLPGGPS